MADSTIDNLPGGSPAQGTDEFPIQRGGSTLKLTVQDVLDQVPGVSIQSATVNLTSDDILALASSPFQILPAQGPGTLAIPIGWFFLFLPGTTPYTGTGTNVQLHIGGVVVENPVLETDVYAGISQKNLMYAAASQEPSDGFTILASGIDNQTNQAVKLAADSDPTDGDGTAKVTLYYILATGLPQPPI